MCRSLFCVRSFLAVAALCALALGQDAFAAPGGAGQGTGKPASPGAETPGEAAEEGSAPGEAGAGAAAGQGETTTASGGSGKAASQGKGKAGVDQDSDSAEKRIKAERDKSAEEFGRWLASAKEGRSLAGMEERIRAIAGPALAAGVPLEAFTARIREAFAKGASPAVTARALEADAASWTWLAGLVRGETWPPAKSAPGFYLAVSAALRNGLDEESVRAVVEWAARSRASAEKAGAALTAAAAVSAALGPATGAKAVALTLAESRLPVGRYGELAALARRAAASGLSPGRFARALEATLGRGGTLAELERSLFP